ncbi:UTRA domain-containing protein [Streptomyces goshikiensis]|uniref:UTRA domain-containing protein n=1 Tax=Streptomyces goshikiensis TaxID=1942 RepID=UPI00371BC6C4
MRRPSGGSTARCWGGAGGPVWPTTGVSTEKVAARMPTAAEAAALGVGERVPVLCVERVVRGRGGRVLEAFRVVGAADRVELHYDELPLAGGVV